MEVVYTHCAGLDVHKKTVVACLITPDPRGGWHHETRSLSTMTSEWLVLSDWLLAAGCTHVAMERARANTGNRSSLSWKPPARCCWSMPSTSTRCRAARRM